MVQTENAEWEAFEAQLDDVVPDTSDSTQNGQSDEHHDSQTDAQAQDELQSACTDEDDSDLEEVEVDRFAMKAEMEAEAGTTSQHHDPTYEALATVPDVAAAQGNISPGSSSTATTRSAEPQSEAAANRARVTERGYLARRRAARKSASIQTAKEETRTTKKKAASKSQNAGARTRSAPSQGQHIAAARVPNSATALPSTPSAAATAHPVPLPRPHTGDVPTPSASSSSALAIPTPSSSRAATSPATMPPPPPLPVGPTGRRQLWEGELKLGLPHLKAGYRIVLPPARPASAPVVGATSAGPVPQVGARHQSAPVASTSSGKRSRNGEDRGERVVRKRAKANNSTAPSQQQRQPPVSSSIRAPRSQWIPYSAQRPGNSRQREHLSASRPTGLPAQTQHPEVSSHQGQQMHRIAPPPPTAPPSSSTSSSTSQVAMQMSGAPRYFDVNAVAPQQSSERPMRALPVGGPSRRAYEQEQGNSGLQHPRNRAQTPSGGAGHNMIVPQRPLPATPEAGPSRGAQAYNRAGVQNPYSQPESPQSYMMPVPSGWNDPAAVPRTFTRAGSSVPTMQTEGNSMYRRVQEAPVAYAAQPQQQMGRPALSMYGAPGAEQLPRVYATGGQPVYNQPYAPSQPAGWNSSAQLQAMSGGETVPGYLTIYAPPNYPPPGWNPQAPVYEQEPSLQSFSRGQSAYGYGYDF